MRFYPKMAKVGYLVGYLKEATRCSSKQKMVVL